MVARRLRSLRSLFAALVVAPLALSALSALATSCKNQGEESATKASEHTASLAQLTEKDVGEVEKGLPEGAKRLATLFAKGDDPRQNLPGVRRELQKIRRDVPELLVAKSTFFAVADDKGIAVRNDLEQDVMAGQNLVSIFPDLSKSLNGNYVETSGVFPGPPGPAGPDRDWIAAAPIPSDTAGKVAGVLVTGWTYRAFARHLQESLKRDLQGQLMQSGETGKLPVLYVAVFDKTGAYGAPQTPEVSEKALTEQDLVSKTASGPAKGVMTITDRSFGWAAIRTPKLGPDAGVAVLRSEI